MEKLVYLVFEDAAHDGDALRDRDERAREWRRDQVTQQGGLGRLGDGASSTQRGPQHSGRGEQPVYDNSDTDAACQHAAQIIRCFAANQSMSPGLTLACSAVPSRLRPHLPPLCACRAEPPPFDVEEFHRIRLELERGVGV